MKESKVVELSKKLNRLETLRSRIILANSSNLEEVKLFFKPKGLSSGVVHLGQIMTGKIEEEEQTFLEIKHLLIDTWKHEIEVLETSIKKA